jgi:hypothetical protein
MSTDTLSVHSTPTVPEAPQASPSETPMPSVVPPTKEASAVPTDLPAPAPTEIVSTSRFIAPDNSVCSGLADKAGKAFKLTFKSKRGDFWDYTTDQRGASCQISAQATGKTITSPGEALAKLAAVFSKAGWQESIIYQADGPSGSAKGFIKNNLICLSSANWVPVKADLCSPDQPISECPLKPTQKSYTLLMNCAATTNAPVLDKPAGAWKVVRYLPGAQVELTDAQSKKWVGRKIEFSEKTIKVNGSTSCTNPEYSRKIISMNSFLSSYKLSVEAVGVGSSDIYQVTTKCKSANFSTFAQVSPSSMLLTWKGVLFMLEPW